jgi:outer membrane protein assembly factor BamB
VKSLLHAYARGIKGGGVPLMADLDPAEIQRRGKGLRFVSQYGSLARDATPDGRVAILSRTCRQLLVARGMYELHAMYYHLSRLGYPPALVSDDELLQTGVPQPVKVLVLVQEQIPLEPEIAEAIAAFQKRGGKVLSVGKSTVAVAGAVSVPGDVKQLWDLGGFEAGGHAAMWREFNEHWRQPLTDAMTTLEFQPAAAMDSQTGMALATDAGPLRYVTVIADAAGTHSNDFQRPRGLQVSLEGTGFTVRDLAHQETLKATTKNGRTLVSLDLVTEPATVLALYPQSPETVGIEQVVSPRLGGKFEFRTSVWSRDGNSLGRVPVECVLTGPDGNIRRQWFEAADGELRVPLAAHDQAGDWKLSVQELLTGKTALATVEVLAAKAPADAQDVGDVHVIDAGHLRSFVEREGEKLVIVEPRQQALFAVATRLTESLNAAGVKARLWKVAPEEFDTVPLRWYPRPDETARLERIAAGELIGYRGNLLAHIDKFKRAHVPELGGYTEVGPPYMVGQDCIVFSGGRLAESLRAASSWLGSPGVPGQGQGRLLVTFSAFMADRQALAVIANDEAGLNKAADRLIQTAKAGAPRVPPVKTVAVKMLAAPTSAESRPVDQPYREYSPQLRAAKLLASPGGRSVLLLNGNEDNLAFVDERGKVTATLQAADVIKSHLQIDDAGRLHALVQKVVEKDPAWHFPTVVEIAAQTITPAGKLASEQTVYTGDTGSLPPDWEAGFATAPDGERAIVSRAGALFAGKRAAGSLGGGPWQTYRDVERAHWRFSVLYSRHAVGSTFSPDGRFVLFTMDSRPPFGGLGSPSYPPTGSETVLWDIEKGEVRWRLSNTAQYMRAPYAVHSGFAAVARDGKAVALAGYDGSIYLIDAAGSPLIEQAITPTAVAAAGRLGPTDCLGVSMSDGGELAAYAFKNLLLVASGERVARVELPRVSGVAVLADGSAAVVALSSGELRAFDPAGQPKWDAKIGGAGTVIAAAGKDWLLAASGAGELVMLDGGGKEVWRTDVAAAADKSVHPLEPAADFVQLPPPADYTEPETLKFAQEQLKAKEITRWTPAGPATDAWGRKFHALAGKIELAAGPAENAILHLVYRRLAGNKSLSIAVTDAGGKNEFLLDLPTTTYRVVDIPLAGKGAKIAVTSDGPAEIAECSLWSFAWPGANLCYVKPAGATADAKSPAKGDAGAADLDDLLDDAVTSTTDRPQGAGAVKTCKIYCANSDVDRVAGTYLPVPLDPTQIADGRRFEGGKLPLWSPSNSAYFPTRGAFFTIDLGKSQPIGVLATYDRSLKQSQVARRIAVFSTEELDDVTSGKVLAGETQNDQFWRLFPLGKSKLGSLGVHIYSGNSQAAGLSEVEAYRPASP